MASPLLYACVAYNDTILTEYATAHGSHTSNLANLVLAKIGHTSAQKLTYAHGDHHVHFISEGPDGDSAKLTFLVTSDAASGRRSPFGFLEEVRKQFLAHVGTKYDCSTLPMYGASEFNSKLKELLNHYSSPDAIDNVRSEIDNVRGIMTKNIEGLLERGERMDLLVDRTDRLGGRAADFRLRSRNLKRRMWWQNIKMIATIIGVLVFIILIIFISIHGI